MDDLELNSYILDLERLARDEWASIPADRLRPLTVLRLAREIRELRELIAAIFGDASYAPSLPLEQGELYGAVETLRDAWAEGYKMRQYAVQQRVWQMDGGRWRKWRGQGEG